MDLTRSEDSEDRAALLEAKAISNGVRETLEHTEAMRREFQNTRMALGIFSRSLGLQQAHFERELNKTREERRTILPANPTSSAARLNAAQLMYESGRDFLESVLPICNVPHLEADGAAATSSASSLSSSLASLSLSTLSSPPPSSSSRIVEGGVCVLPAGAKKELSSEECLSQGVSETRPFWNDGEIGEHQEGGHAATFGIRRKQPPRGSVSSVKIVEGNNLYINSFGPSDAICI